MVDLVGGFAAMQHHPGDALLAACAAQAAQRIEETSPEELSRLLWGFAELKCEPGPAALAAYAAHAAKCIHKASPQLMARTLMGFAKLGHAPDGALLRACEAAVEAPAAKSASQPVVRGAMRSNCPAHSTSGDQACSEEQGQHCTPRAACAESHIVKAPARHA